MAGGNRETKVVLTAQVAGYLSGFEQAKQKTKQTAEEAAKLEAQLQKQHAAMSTLGVGMTAFGAVAAAGVAIAVSKFMEFDAQMSAVQAATHESAENMALLRDAAMEAGAVTAFSATEAAQAIEELSKAGVATADILGGGLQGALDLAAAGELAVGQAAEIAATAMTQFNQSGSQVPHIADLLAAGAGKAQGSVDDLSQALNQGGLVASQAGFSIEETTGTLSAFAAAGLLGSDAGTSLKTAILALQNPSKKSSDTMAQYGIEVYNANGTMKSFSEIAGVLEGSLGGLTDEQRNSALAQIFGNDAVRAANVLYANGQDGINQWTRNVDDAGYAAETAAIKQDNLAGDLEKLGGAFDTLLIKTGAGADGPLRFLVQSVTDLVDAFSDAPPIVQQTGLALGVTAAAVGLAGGAVLIIIPKVYELKIALDVLASSSIPGVGSAAVGMTNAVGKSGAALAATARFLTGPWGIALVAATVGVKLLSDYLESLKASSEEVTNSLVTAKDASEIFDTVSQGRAVTAWADVNAQLNDLPTLLAAANEQQENWLSRFGGREYFGGIQALKDIGEELASLAESDLPGAQEAFTKLAAETDGSKEQLMQLLDAMPAYKDALTEQATQSGEAATDASLLTMAQATAEEQAIATASAYVEQAAAGDDVVEMINELIEQVNNLNETNQDAVSANADFLQSLEAIQSGVDDQKKAYEEANGTLEGFSQTLDEATFAGAAQADQLAQVAAKAQEAADAQFAVDQTTMSATDATDKYVATLRDQRARFEEAAVAAGYSKDEVQKLADRVFALPSAREIKIMAETAAAQAGIDNLISLNSGRVVRVSVRATNDSPASSWTGGLTQADGGVVDYYANGGVAESHTAQIAPAGAWRVWAEPETGGEAYIPLAASKRERSLAVWAETGKRLQAFADGGVWSADRYMGGASSGGVTTSSVSRSSSLSQTIYAPEGVSAFEVARIAAADRDWAMKGDA